MKAERTYAIAVRDGAELFLFLTIARSALGDVYVNILHNRREGRWSRWKPHASYHASGQRHQKSFGRAFLVSQRQKPNADFRDTENIVTMAIPVDEPRRLNRRCHATDFYELFEISIGDLTPDTQISVDVAEANGKAIVTPGATIVRQTAFEDEIPWILVTIYLNPAQYRTRGTTMTWWQRFRVWARSVSVYLKIGSAVLGLVAAYFWYQSAVTSDEAAVDWNMWAALITGASMGVQALSAAIDAWISPTATWTSFGR